jgi:hypothetical protein
VCFESHAFSIAFNLKIMSCLCPYPTVKMLGSILVRNKFLIHCAHKVKLSSRHEDVLGE